MDVEGHKVRAYDLGGRQRDFWPDYLVSSGCVVFVVDASDPERFPESKAELDVRVSFFLLFFAPLLLLLLCSLFWPFFFFLVRKTAQKKQALLSNVDLFGVPFVVFGNKCDLDESVSERAFRDAMGLSLRRSRPIDVFMCSARERYGYKSGMRWVSHFF